MRISDMMLQDLPTIWHAPTTDMRLKQHIARILLHEIVVCVYSHAPVVLKTPPMSDHSVPNTVTPRFAEIIKLVEGVCRTHLTEEYAAVIRKLTAALARKRPSPLLRGHSRTWACGITYTVGSLNFLFDPAQQPHVRGVDLCALLGVSPSAGSAKSLEIVQLFDIVPLDPRWTLPTRLVENPLVWMIPVNGVIVDMRMMPRELQERAYAMGLIPFVPAAHGETDGAS